jgi:hypothetical protein
MTGAALLGLVLLSMAWLFFLGGLAAKLTAKPGRRLASRLGFLPGVAGSLAVFFSVPALASYGFEVPWPWLWILLPLALDVVLLVLRHRMRRSS